MGKRRWVGWVLVLAAVQGPALRAQFRPEELAERPKREEFLNTARIVAQKQLGGEDAVTNPWQLTLEEGGLRKRALWKNPQRFMGGYLEGWRYEIAAYLMDGFLGLGMVPPTVEKRFGEIPAPASSGWTTLST